MYYLVISFNFLVSPKNGLNYVKIRLTNVKYQMSTKIKKKKNSMELAKNTYYGTKAHNVTTHFKIYIILLFPFKSSSICL